jgi:hypothetical protein
VYIHTRVQSMEDTSVVCNSIFLDLIFQLIKGFFFFKIKTVTRDCIKVEFS